MARYTALYQQTSRGYRFLTLRKPDGSLIDPRSDQYNKLMIWAQDIWGEQLPAVPYGDVARYVFSKKYDPKSIRTRPTLSAMFCSLVTQEWPKVIFDCSIVEADACLISSGLFDEEFVEELKANGFDVELQLTEENTLEEIGVKEFLTRGYINYFRKAALLPRQVTHRGNGTDNCLFAEVRNRNQMLEVLQAENALTGGGKAVLHFEIGRTTGKPVAFMRKNALRIPVYINKHTLRESARNAGVLDAYCIEGDYVCSLREALTTPAMFATVLQGI